MEKRRISIEQSRAYNEVKPTSVKAEQLIIMPCVIDYSNGCRDGPVRGNQVSFRYQFCLLRAKGCISPGVAGSLVYRGPDGKQGHPKQEGLRNREGGGRGKMVSSDGRMGS